MNSTAAVVAIRSTFEVVQPGSDLLISGVANIRFACVFHRQVKLAKQTNSELLICASHRLEGVNPMLCNIRVSIH